MARPRSLPHVPTGQVQPSNLGQKLKNPPRNGASAEHQLVGGFESQCIGVIRRFSTSLSVWEPQTSAWPVAGWPGMELALCSLHTKDRFWNHPGGRKSAPAAPVGALPWVPLLSHRA